MGKYELTISPDYAGEWGIDEAIRELFQNAFDQEALDKNNTASWQYISEEKTLTISNKQSKLDKSTLLLGGGTKADQDSTVGQFGEGYKLATLVLLREGLGITFYNNKEIWKPRFVNSKRFGAKVLTFFTESAGLFKRNNDLEVFITGLEQDDYNCLDILQLRDDYKVIYDTDTAQIIDQPGKIYVNGLFVCTMNGYKYGYNVSPSKIKLGRDRQFVDGYNIGTITSQAWAETNDIDSIMEMLWTDMWGDCRYIGKQGNNFIVSEAVRLFRDKYGSTATPVAWYQNEQEFDNPKQVPSHMLDILRLGMDIQSTVYVAKDELDKWFDSVSPSLTEEQQEAFRQIRRRL